MEKKTANENPKKKLMHLYMNPNDPRFHLNIKIWI